MTTKVIVIPSQNGGVINLSKNPEYGFIKLKQMKTVFNNGFADIVPIHAIINGKVEVLKQLGFTANQELEGQIVIKESLTPFNKKSPSIDIKTAGPNQEVNCKKDGEVIYRKSFYTTDMNDRDELVEHDNSEEIREAFKNAKQNPSSSLDENSVDTEESFNPDNATEL